jgi:TonB family protein
MLIRHSTHVSTPQRVLGPLVLMYLAPTKHKESVVIAGVPVVLVDPPVPTVSNPLSVDDSVESGTNIAAQLGGRITPPRPADDQPISPREFARRAGVRPGIGATVVLRVEVRGNGAVGQVAVDVSGGTALVDKAAIACVRAMRWVAGQRDGQPQTLWVRWGVRFDG